MWGKDSVGRLCCAYVVCVNSYVCMLCEHIFVCIYVYVCEWGSVCGDECKKVNIFIIMWK